MDEQDQGDRGVGHPQRGREQEEGEADEDRQGALESRHLLQIGRLCHGEVRRRISHEYLMINCFGIHWPSLEQTDGKSNGSSPGKGNNHFVA